MNYVYNDEDNAPMNEDEWRKYTTYSCKAESDYYENGGFEADQEARESAYAELKKEHMEAVLDKLGLEGGCRECDYILETAEGFMDSNGKMGPYQFEHLHMMCVGCHGKGTGKIQEEHENRLVKEWAEIKNWCKGYELNHWYCPWCENVYEVYGHYKDPDDEWKAIEDLCCKCEHFGEG